MKTLFLTAILAMTLASCNSKAKETENNPTESTTKSEDLFACSMHPEVTGKKGEKCSKCGMELTEKITNKKVDTKIYACPMHSEVQGKLNDKCSKCGMPLTEPVPTK